MHLERLPAPALARHVACVWVQRVAPNAGPSAHRTIPHGSVELACPVGGAPRVVGPQTGPVLETLEPGAVVVGVRFHPGAAPPVLGLPASELVDLDVAAAELWGAGARRLGERVAASLTEEAAGRALEEAVRWRLARAAHGGDLDPVAVEAVRRLGPWRDEDVGSLPAALAISERQLRRRCHAAVGVPPKALQRMLRFQGFLAVAQSPASAGGELARLAADVGFADQAHLTRESVRLAGQTPAALLRDARRHCDPAHDHAASRAPLLRAREDAAAAAA